MTASTLELARERLLAPAGIGDSDLNSVLDRLLGHAVDSADLYFQSTRFESWVLEDGIVKEGSHSIEQGVGVRAISGDKTGFAYSDEIVMPALVEASRQARAIARSGRQAGLQAWRPSGALGLYQPLDPLHSLSADAKVDLLKRLDAEARRQDPRVQQVVVSLAGVHEVVLVAASDGTLAADVRPLVRMNVSVIVEHNGRREQGSSGGGGRSGYEMFLEGDRALEHAREAVRQALVNLDAVDAPAGNMTVVLGPGWPGVLLHEAIGHGLEGDFNRKGTSAFAGRVGQKVASPLCTVVDDGTLPGRRGSLNIDDEGTPTECTVLIENGVLKGYMQDKMNARLMGVAAYRQRPPRVLRAPADAAHDQHLHARRPVRSRRDHPLRGQGSVRRELRRRPGGHHLRQVRVLGERGLSDRERQGHAPGERRDPGRQRSRRAHPRVHGRQRSEARPGRRHLRQGRSERPGRRGPADPARGRPDGGRHERGVRV
jgi:TldD protein